MNWTRASLVVLLGGCRATNPFFDGASSSSEASSGSDADSADTAGDGDGATSDATSGDGTTGDGDGDGDGDGTTGDGDGDGASGDGDGDGDGTTGDGDGDGATGDGTTGDGDGASGDGDSTTGDGTTGDGTTGDGDGDGDGTTGDGDGYCDAATGLVLCHDFDNFSGTTSIDGSGTGNDMLTQNAVIEAGPFANLIRGDANAVYEVADSASLDLTTAFTFELWVAPDSFPASGRTGLIDKDGQYSLLVHPDGVECGSNVIGHAARTLLPLGTFSHIACTWDGSDLRLYVDGSLFDTIAAAGTLATANTNPMAVGDTSPAFDEPFDGRMDGLRIWNTPRSAVDICAASGSASC